MIKYVKNNLNYQHLKIEKLNLEEYHRHVHNRFEFLYFQSGVADYVINATTYTLTPGDLLFIPAYSYHYLSPNPNFSYERICIHFPKELIPSSIAPIAMKLKPIYHIKKNSTIDRIFSSLLRCEYVYEYETQDMIQLIEREIGNILTHLKYRQVDETNKNVTENHELKIILDYIDEHVREPLDVEILAKNFYKSPSWIAHTFSQVLQISPKKYINNKKILYAQGLISSGTPPMRAAEMLSFDNYVTFYRAYLKFLGNTPNQDFVSSQQ